MLILCIILVGLADGLMGTLITLVLAVGINPYTPKINKIVLTILVLLGTIGGGLIGNSVYRNIQKDDVTRQKLGCDYYKEQSVTDIPVKCLSHFGITSTQEIP